MLAVARGRLRAGRWRRSRASSPLGASRASQARNRVTAAPSRRCAARVPSSSTGFLHAFGSRHGSAARWICAAGRAEPVEHPGRGGRRIDLHPCRSAARARRAPAPSRSGGSIVDARCRDGGRGRATSLRRSMNSVTRAVVAQDREGQRQRRVRHVAAADVEQPGDRFGHRQHRRGDALLGQRARRAGRASLRRSRRRIRSGCGTTGASGGGRPAGPDPVERVVVDRRAASAPARSAPARSRSTSCGVCSQGS